MDGPEDKGPRYRLVMFVALAAIVGPGFFLLNWIGDNGVNNLFRQLVGLDAPKARVTRTVTPEASVIAFITPAASPSATATVTVGPSATAPVLPPTASPTKPLATTPPVATSPATSEPTRRATVTVPPATFTPTPRPPTATPKPLPTNTPKPQTDYLGPGKAIPAYGGAAVMRAEPSTEAEAVGSVPEGEAVMVIRLVEGEAIDPVESRWWEIEYGEVRGFVYYKLVELD